MLDVGAVVAAIIAIITCVSLYRIHRRTRLSLVYLTMGVALLLYLGAETAEFLSYIRPGLFSEAFHAVFEVAAFLFIAQGLHTMYLVWKKVEEPISYKPLLIDYLAKFPDYMDVLKNEIRLNILINLYENVEMSYTELLRTLNIDKGLLNFHLKKLKGVGFIRVTEAGTYTLSKDGKAVLGALIYVIRDIIDQRRAFGPRLTWSLALRRVGAFLVDVAILGVFTGAFFSHGLSQALLRLLTLELTPSSLTYEAIYPYIPIFYLSMLYFTLFEGYKGQTPGKYLFRIRVQRVDGLRPTLMDIIIRNLGKVLFLPMDIALGLLLYRKKKFLRLFDYYTQTTVIEAI